MPSRRDVFHLSCSFRPHRTAFNVMVVVVGSSFVERAGLLYIPDISEPMLAR